MSLEINAIRAQRGANLESQARKLANVIYPGILKPYAQSFFNRDSLLEQRLQASILNGQPIQMVGFWGIGGKQQLDRYDESLLSEYEAIRTAIGQQYSHSVDMMLILANAHGRFNGYQNFDRYLETIASEANRRKIASVSLNDLYQEWKINLPDSNQPIDKKSREWNEFAQSRRFNQFVKSAERHSRVGINPEDAAFRYWQMRRQEREPLSQSFSKGILLVNGSEDLGRETLPLTMPHIYMKIGPVWFLHD